MAKGERMDPVDALAQLAFAVVGIIERRAAEQGLSLIQTRLLGVLRDREPTMNELGEHLGLDKSSVSGLVGRAAQRGLVTRVPSQLDGRSVHVRLSDAGRAIAAFVTDAVTDDLSALLGRIAKADRRNLHHAALRLLAEHDAARGEAHATN